MIPGQKTPIHGNGEATLKGRVIYDGEPPEPKSLAKLIGLNRDKNICLDGDAKDPLWMVGPDRGVANVVVWLKAPDGQFFMVPEGLQRRTDRVVIDQPHCAFEPHVAAIYPSFYDATDKKQKQTGQEFEIKNSASMNHNTAWHGNPLLNSGGSWIIPPGKHLTIDAKPCRNTEAGKEDLLLLSCDIHKWMTGKVAVFDQPFYAVTNARGEFEIPSCLCRRRAYPGLLARVHGAHFS